MRQDFLAFFTFVEFLAHGLALFVGLAVVGIAFITREHSVTGSTLSPGCFLSNPLTSVRKATFADLTTTVFRFFYRNLSCIPNTSSPFRES